MLTIFPFLPFLAASVAAVLLVVRWIEGDAGPVARGVLVTWFLAAVYCQFFGGTAVLSAAGLALQTALAVYLLVWWQLHG